MTSIETIIELYYQAQKFHLENTDILERYSFEDLAKIYNGIGPDSFPEWLRKVISSLHPSLAPVALIHDVEWHESDKTKDSFSESNARFKRNGKAVAKCSFSFFNPRRYIVWNQARRFGNYCELFGWSAWCSPCEARLWERPHNRAYENNDVMGTRRFFKHKSSKTSSHYFHRKSCRVGVWQNFRFLFSNATGLQIFKEA